jgi:hypothetical protein
MLILLTELTELTARGYSRQPRGIRAGIDKTSRRHSDFWSLGH